MQRVSIGLAILVAFASAPAVAVSLNARSSTIELRCASSPPDTRTTVAEINTGQCDLNTTSGSVQAIAEAYLESPEVFVDTYASAYDSAVSAEAKASLDMQLRINLDSAPPIPTATVPVYTNVSGEADLYGASTGSARLTLTGPGYDSGSVLAIAPPNLFGRRVTADLEPDEVYMINLAASCYSVDSPGGDLSHCTALMDPGVFFDQAAFDAQLGASSFNLADYYSIEVSAVVPIPGAAWLFGSGLVGLIGIARKSKSA